MPIDATITEFEQNGHLTIPSVLPHEQCDSIIREICALQIEKAGTRNLLELSCCRDLSLALKSHPVVSALLPTEAVAVQCIYFEKSEKKNWLVGWHQDLSMPVKERIDDPTCQNWTKKEGINYAQPPTAILETLVAVRVHLDDSNEDNGPLRVVPGSHKLGRILEDEINDVCSKNPEITCCVQKGGILILRPLLLHASSKVNIPSNRRVLHFLFGPSTLPGELQWYSAV